MDDETYDTYAIVWCFSLGEKIFTVLTYFVAVQSLRILFRDLGTQCRLLVDSLRYIVSRTQI